MSFHYCKPTYSENKIFTHDEGKVAKLFIFLGVTAMSNPGIDKGFVNTKAVSEPTNR
jgi:hypothetical protein